MGGLYCFSETTYELSRQSRTFGVQQSLWLQVQQMEMEDYGYVYLFWRTCLKLTLLISLFFVPLPTLQISEDDTLLITFFFFFASLYQVSSTYVSL